MKWWTEVKDETPKSGNPNEIGFEGILGDTEIAVRSNRAKRGGRLGDVDHLEDRTSAPAVAIAYDVQRHRERRRKEREARLEVSEDDSGIGYDAGT